MIKLVLDPTETTPYVKLDAESGIIELSGTSYPEDPAEYYGNIFEWIKENFNESSPKIDVSVKLVYFNTGSSKCLMNLFQLLGRKSKVNNNKISVSWFYNENDDDMLEAGQAYENLTRLPFKMVEMQ